MFACRNLLNRLADVFISNTAMFTVADPNQIIVSAVNVPFTPGLNTAIGDVPVHGAPLSPTNLTVLTDATEFAWTDPLTDERVVKLAFVAGQGVIRGGVGTYPFTIYGVRLTSADGATLLATQTLDTPVHFTKNSDGAKCPPIEFRFPPTLFR